MIDARLPRHDQEVLTAGEAVAGMMLNGLGFSNRPVSLTPQFFVNNPSTCCVVQASTLTCATVSHLAAALMRSPPLGVISP